MHSATLSKIEQLSPSTRLFRFEVVERLAFTPGQFYRLTLQDDLGEFERSYSFSQLNLDPSEGYFDLVISEVVGGRATQLLFNAEPGLIVHLKGPFGRLVLPDGHHRQLFLIATSVGVAPFLPMLPELEGQRHDAFDSVHLLLGARDQSEFIFKDELLALRARADWFDVTVCFSREQRVREAWEHLGYVTSALKSFSLAPNEDFALVCGNPMMIDDVYRDLRALKFGPRRVIREKYVFAAQEKGNAKAALSSGDQALLKQKMAQYTNQGVAKD